ncbi:hypothetical protein ACTMU2_32860 [Cupriavidus basilensis]
MKALNKQRINLAGTLHRAGSGIRLKSMKWCAAWRQREQFGHPIAGLPASCSR